MRARTGTKAVAVLLSATALAIAVGRSGALEAIQRRLDYLFALVAPSDPSSSQVVLVRITEQDYQQEFGGKRPLNADTLRGMIEAIAQHQPAVIGVDIDTSDPTYDGLRTIGGGTPIVWARDLDLQVSDREIRPVLGYSSVEAEGVPGPLSGVTRLEVDSDGIVRTYRRWFDTPYQIRPSFTCALIQQCERNAGCAQALQLDVAESCRPEQADFAVRMINYRRAGEADAEAPKASAVDVLSSIDKHLPDQARWGKLFQNRIVIVGGSYRASGDTGHPTPLGGRDGVSILSHIIATELRGGGVRPTNFLATGFLVAFETYLLVLALRFQGWRPRIAAGVLAIVGLAAAASIVNEHSLTRTPYFSAVLLCVVVLQSVVLYIERSQQLFVELWSDFVAWLGRRSGKADKWTPPREF